MVRHGATLQGMPMAHPRHTITETPPDDAKAAREAAQRLAERIRRRLLPVDAQAADEVKYRGLIAD